MRLTLPVAIGVMTAGSGWVAPAQASDFGCQVVLCLSNPGGPMEYGACVPPITKLYEILATGGSFPICSEGNVRRTKTHGHRGSSDYRVTMTYADGSEQTYSLAGIGAAPPGQTAPLPGATVQP